MVAKFPHGNRSITFSAFLPLIAVFLLAAAAIISSPRWEVAHAQSAGINLTATSLSVDENDEYWEYFQVSLATKPEGYVGINVEVEEQTNARLVVGVINSYSQFVDCEAGDTCYIHINDDEWDDYQTVYVNALIDDNRAGGSGKIKVSAVSGDSNYNGHQREVSVTESDTVGAAMLFPDGRPGRISEGGTASFSVALAVEPYADVTVAVTSSHPDITVSPASLTFTATNYSTKKSVTLRAKEDNIAQTATTTVKLTASSSGDSDYDKLTNSFNVTEVENDTARFVLSNFQSPLTVAEGGSHTYSVRLNSEPSANVTVTISGAANGITVAPTSLTFNSNNYGTAQNVTVSAAEDDDNYTSETATLTHSVGGASEYTSRSISNVAVTTRDNDTEILVDADPNTSGNQTALTVREGSTASYTVELNIRPTANVTVAITEATTGNHADTSLRVTSPSSKTLTFTPQNWDTGQTVRIRANSDSDAINGTRTITHTASGAAEFAGKTESLTATERDSQARINLRRNNSNVSSVTVVEEATETYDVSLNAQPAANVTVTIAEATTGNYTDADITVTNPSNKMLTFTPQNWNAAQTVTLSAATDIDLADGRRTITHTAGNAGSVQSGYADISNNVITKSLTAREDDNDTGGIMFDQATVNVAENGTGTYRVKLTHQPHGTAYLRVSAASGAGNDTDITVRDTRDDQNGNQTGSIPFNATTWNTYRTVTLAARDDADKESGSRTINHTVNGGGYSNITGSVTANEAEDDHAIILTPLTGVTITEGSTATYTVKLASAPTATVTIAVAGATTGDHTDPSITVAPATLTFTPTGSTIWSTAQTVTLTAAQDSDRFDGSRTINHTATSTDSNYSNLTVSLLAQEDDDDSPHDRDTLREFSLHTNNGSPYGIWTDGTTMWVTDDQDYKLYAYTLATGARDTSKEFNLNSNNRRPYGIWSDGTTIWVTNYNSTKMYAYTLATGAQDTSKEFTLFSSHRFAGGIWSDGTTMYVTHVPNWGASRVYAYDLATGARDTTRAFDLHTDNGDPAGIWSDGTTMWVADDDDKVYAYTLVGGVRDSAKDFNLADSTTPAQDNGNPAGVWSDGTTMWVADSTDGKVYAYHAPTLTTRLEAADATATSMQLTITWHTGDWWYKYTTPSGGQCSANPVSTTSTRVTGLALNRTHTFAAYGDRACSDANLLATAGSLDTKDSRLALSSFSKTTNTYDVTLTLDNYDVSKDGAWYYKTNLSGARGNCVAAATNPVTVTGFSFSANETHTFTAYSDSACRSSAKIAAAPRFKPNDGLPALTAGSITLSGATLTLSNFSDSWWYNSDYGATGCTRGNSGTYKASLSNLTPGTRYAYLAFSRSGCAQPDTIDSATFTTGAAGDRDTAKDINLPNYDYGDAWSNGTTIWALNWSGKVLEAYTLATGARDTSKEFNLHTDNARGAGIWSDRTTIWVADTDDSKLYAYKLADGTRQDGTNNTTNKEFDTNADNADPVGIWSNGTTIWVGDASDNKVYAYTLAGGARDTGKEFDTHSNNSYLNGIWSNGTTMWVAGTYNNPQKVYAYTLAGGARDTSKEFNLTPATIEPVGLWSDGATMWVLNSADTKLYAYHAHPTHPELTATNIGPTGATLEISRHTAAWWYQRATPTGDNTCRRAAANTTRAALSGLAADTKYTYTAYDRSGCRSTDEIASGTFTTADFGDRDTTKEFALDDNLNINARQIWSDGATMWVVDATSSSEKLFAYTLATGARDTSKEFNLDSGNTNPQGLWSDGTTVWVADLDDNKLYAYTLATGARDTSKEFNLYTTWGSGGNRSPAGLWSDGTTMWVLNVFDRKLYAYDLATGARDAARESALAPTTPTIDNANGLWSDGTTMWVADYYDEKVYAFNLATGARDTAREYDLDVNRDLTVYATGIWSDGATLWVVEANQYEMHAYHAYTPTPRLAVTGIGNRGATLTMHWHAEDWWYKRTAPTGNNSCRQVAAGTTTATLSGLPDGSEYTYKAYDDRGCGSGNEIGSVTFSTTTLTIDDPSATTMRLTIASHTGDWYYKYTSPSGGRCSEKVTGTTTRATGLAVNRAHTFAAYSNSTCSQRLTTAAPHSTTTPALAAVAGSAAGTVNLTLSGWTITDFISVPPWVVDKDGNWYTKYTTPKGGQCSTPQKALTGSTTDLVVGTAYTFAAYSDSACANLVATAAAVTAPGGAGSQSLGATGQATGATGPTGGDQGQVGGAGGQAEAGELPGSIASVIVVHNGDNVSALWAAADNADSYEGQYSYNGGITWNPVTVPAGGTVLTIQNVSSEWSYIVGVRPRNAAGNGAWTYSAAVSVGRGAAALAEVGSPSLTVGADGSAAWSYTFPQGAQYVYTALRWVTTAMQEADDWSGTNTQVFYDAAANKYALTGLSAGMEYKAMVIISLTVNGEIRQAKSDTVVFTMPPDSVAGVTASRESGNIAASWNGVTGATGYDVRYSTDDGATWTKAATNQSETTYTLTGADNSLAYVIGVRAVNSGGESGWTDSATVAAVPPPPASVSGVTASRESGNIAASWDGVTGATGYDVRYSTDDGATWTKAATNQSETTYTLTGADNSLAYVVGVRAVNSGGESGWTDSATVPAEEGASTPVQPQAPAGVTASRESGSIAASWDGVTGATGYDVRYSTDDGATWTKAATNQTETTYTLSGADNSLAYVIGVRAVNSGGESGWTDSDTVPAVSQPAQAPGKVTNLSASREKGGITVSWDAVAGATKYHITYSTDGEASWSLAAAEHTTNGITISNADASLPYIVGVRAGNSVGWSGWVNSRDVPAVPQQPAQAPGKVTNLSASRGNGNITVSWDAVAGATKYHITYSTDGGASWSLAAAEHTTNGITISNADASLPYIVGVRAGNATGWSSWVNSKEVPAGSSSGNDQGASAQ